MIASDILDAYERLVATQKGIERKGKAMPYTSINGNMFSFLDPSGTLCLRMSNEDRASFMSKFESQPCIQHGAVMKEYVVVPEALLRDIKKLTPYFAKSYKYVMSLKPKSSAKKTTAKAKK